MLYLKEQKTGVGNSVSLYKNISSKRKLPINFYKSLINVGWGCNISEDDIYIYYFKNNEKRTILLENQKLIKKKLFVLGIKEEKDSTTYALSINHYLADERTLNLFINLIETGINISIKDAINKAKTMKSNYKDYIQKQYNFMHSPYKNKNEFKPIKLSRKGALSWDIEKPRITISKKLNFSVCVEEFLFELVEFLKEEKVFCSGNILCTSQLWSSVYDYDCLGMTTGLIPIKTDEKSVYSEIKKGVSLEAKAFKDSTYKYILDACLLSELFINTSTIRNIPSQYTLDNTFPVGIEIDHRNDSIVKIILEGKFCSKEAIKKLLNKLELNFKGD
ncbi:hypothetical protein H6L55_11535 [Staphylococcus epidermidis]|uniref:hypothetical protein n=2 Tax=Bacillati TaxID=1783272 RepID=UPI00195A07A9|nr:hypothetical protein [Staphylococcus epidermidis]MBM6078050.1 hypothetical protein [Staphylococcus epidermidis]MBM6082600.1 hypothetical protein [Staphylococcus epidermidis]MEB6727298.1 hypothetical protein [Staphylococcus epidermidis]QRT38539.1 hypothetical protein I6K91_11700 [Staphylococcus epidermidis]